MTTALAATTRLVRRATVSMGRLPVVVLFAAVAGTAVGAIVKSVHGRGQVLVLVVPLPEFVLPLFLAVPSSSLLPALLIQFAVKPLLPPRPVLRPGSVHPLVLRRPIEHPPVLPESSFVLAGLPRAAALAVMGLLAEHAAATGATAVKRVRLLGVSRAGT